MSNYTKGNLLAAALCYFFFILLCLTDRDADCFHIVCIVSLITRVEVFTVSDAAEHRAITGQIVGGQNY